jgi:hypothetical protein
MIREPDDELNVRAAARVTACHRRDLARANLATE